MGAVEYVAFLSVWSLLTSGVATKNSCQLLTGEAAGECCLWYLEIFFTLCVSTLTKLMIADKNDCANEGVLGSAAKSHLC